MTNFKWKNWIKENKKMSQIWVTLITLSLMAVFMQNQGTKPKNHSPRNIDTLIPEGFVLVPVELSNSPSLSGLLADKGVVDLYTGDPARQKAQKVATAIKIIRSPLNPDYFAVLAPAKQAKLLIQRFQGFHAVIQNPQYNKKTQIQPLKIKRRRTIAIELDSSTDF